MTAQEYLELLGEITFPMIKPELSPSGVGYPAGDGGWLASAGPLDLANTMLPATLFEMTLRLAPLSNVPRLSCFPIAVALNLAVQRMPGSECYLNIGVWKGYSLLAGMLGNPDKHCIGVDNFQPIYGASLNEVSNRIRGFASPLHSLIRSDYREYFAQQHSAPIGVYFFDGPHEYEHQLDGLVLAEPYLAKDALVLVDDTNSPAPREATLAFLSERANFELLLDARTCENCHPTWWNGLMILHKKE